MRKALYIVLVGALCAVFAIPTPAAQGAPVPGAAAVEAAADRLYELGLFSGVGDNADGTPNFDLTGTLNRQEAVTMLVRLLGKEGEALAGSWTTLFVDVADWAKPYVGYAYENGLTSGTSAAAFGGTDSVSAAQYLTFVLRALGYSSDSDFAWNAAWELTDELGITNGEYGEGTVLVRGDAALVSANALDVTIKDGSKTLLATIEESLAGNPQPTNDAADDTSESDVPATAGAADDGSSANGAADTNNADDAPSEPSFKVAYEWETEFGVVLFSKKPVETPVKMTELDRGYSPAYPDALKCTIERDTAIALKKDGKLVLLPTLNWMMYDGEYENSYSGHYMDSRADELRTTFKGLFAAGSLIEEGLRMYFFFEDMEIQPGKPYVGAVGNNGMESDKYADEAYNDPKNFLVNEYGTLTGYAGAGKEMHIIVPNGIKTIVAGAFDSIRDDVVSLTLPESTIYINHSEFYNYPNMTDIYMAAGFPNIYDSWVLKYSGTGITTQQIAIDLKKNGIVSDYSELPKLQNYHVGEDGLDRILIDTVAGYDSIDGVLVFYENRFYESTKDYVPDYSLYSYPSGRSGKRSVPNGISTINTRAFRLESKVETLTIPSSVWYIREGAFMRETKIIIKGETGAEDRPLTVGPEFSIQMNFKLQ